ncbi:MAG: hypothetical protein ACPGLV_01195 [Bacteroidia bacterium]
MKKILVLAFVLMGALAQAQDYTYFISTDTVFYPIGGRIKISHEWSTPENINQEPPNLPVNLKKLEQVELGEVTQSNNKGRTIYKQTAIYTCFDTGYYEIPGLAWKVNQDSIISNPLFIDIGMLPIDTTQDIMDVTGPLSIPFTLNEALPYLGGALVLAGLIAGIILLINQRKKKNSGLQKQPQKPAHILAFEQLENLKNQKLWQQGKSSQFHFQLSFIIKNYIQNRYKVDALDLTTAQLEPLLKELKIDQKLVHKLIDVLKIGDLAKFAKANPLPQENESAFVVIEEFVRKTFESLIAESEND